MLVQQLEHHDTLENAEDALSGIKELPFFVVGYIKKYGDFVWEGVEIELAGDGIVERTLIELYPGPAGICSAEFDCGVYGNDDSFGSVRFD